MCAYRVYKFPGALLRVSCPLIQIVEENRGFPVWIYLFLFAFLYKICILPFFVFLFVSFPYHFRSFFLLFSEFVRGSCSFLCALLRILRIFLEFVSSSLLFCVAFCTISLASLLLRSFFVGILWHFREFIGSSRLLPVLPLFVTCSDSQSHEAKNINV